jgi:hypothetical protein
MPIRPASSTVNVLMKPSPSCPRSWSPATRQSWNTTSVVSLARNPSLFSFLPADIPGVPRSTTNAEMPRLPRARSVTAMTTMMPATPPWVMKIFDPLITQQSPWRTATVRVPAASLPAVGSVSPQAPSVSPFARRVRKRAFCASVPKRAMCAEHSPLCAATVMPIEGSMRESSSMAMQ